MHMRSSAFLTVFCLGLLACGVAVAASNTLPVWKAGATEVFLLNDGGGQLNSSILIGASPELLARHYPDRTAPTAYNAFLIRANGKNILVDTGYGKGVYDGLKTLGLTAEDIDTVLITHMHGDHIGGMATDGKAAFPKAEVYVAEKEHAYWTSEANRKAVPEGARDGFVRAVTSLKPYAGKVTVFVPGELEERGTQLLPGVRAITAYGHTPGHTMFLVQGEGGELLIWGDIVHALNLQMEAPEIAIAYDVNPEEAVAVRKKVLCFVAERKIPVAGMHIVPPGMGTVAPAREGKSYVFTPVAR